MTNRRLHLDAGAVFLRLAFWFFVVREVYIWLVRMRPIRARFVVRLVFFLFRKWATPYSVVFALLFAAVGTTLLYLLVRLVLEPLVRSWHTPWIDGSAGLFHVAANERVLGTSPARRRMGRGWAPGTLVWTNLRLWFFPRAHDADIWSRPLDALHEIHLEPAPRIAWGYVLGWPERIALRADGDGGGDHDDETFAVPDPAAVLARFALAGVPPVPSAPPMSSPRSP